MAGPPKTTNGKGCQTFANGAIKGANRQPTLEIVEQDPTVKRGEYFSEKSKLLFLLLYFFLTVFYKIFLYFS